MSRRQGRELSLQMLFLKTLRNDVDYCKIVDYINYFADFNGFTIKASVTFAENTVAETLKFIDEIDKNIIDNLKNWKLDRLSKVDLNIIRIAVYEIIFRSDIPYKVSINEANELGKKYGSKDSHKFINGVLDSIIKKGGV